MSSKAADTKNSQINRSPNVVHVSRLELPGAGQIEVRGDFAYIAHMKYPYGTSIVDISDRKNPRIASQIKLEDSSTHTHKVRAFGDNLICTNVERANRQFIRKGDAIPGLRERLNAEGRDSSDHAIAKELGLTPDDIKILDGLRDKGYDQGGWKIYDVSDPHNPRLIKTVLTHGLGVHRFDIDDNYAYISTEMSGYVGNILVIYDLSEPQNPRELSHWWIPGQKVSAGEKPHWYQDEHRLHHALRFGSEMWAACWHGGYWLVDISDLANPKTVANYQTNPPFIEPAHTFMPLDTKIDGRSIAVGIDEQHERIQGQPSAGLWIFDTTDRSELKPISVFILSELDSPYSRRGGRFGAHQFHEKPVGTLIFATWFSGGLRIIDLANPYRAEEAGYYLPEPAGGNPAPQSNDVFVEDNGLMHLVDRFNGYDILEFTG